MTEKYTLLVHLRRNLPFKAKWSGNFWSWTFFNFRPFLLIIWWCADANLGGKNLNLIFLKMFRICFVLFCFIFVFRLFFISFYFIFLFCCFCHFFSFNLIFFFILSYFILLLFFCHLSFFNLILFYFLFSYCCSFFISTFLENCNTGFKCIWFRRFHFIFS